MADDKAGAANGAAGNAGGAAAGDGAGGAGAQASGQDSGNKGAAAAAASAGDKAGASGGASAADGKKGTDGLTALGAEPSSSDGAKGGELELKVPDGFEANGEGMTKFKAWAKDHGLDSVKAQAVLDLHVEAMNGLRSSFAEQQQARRKAWSEALPKHPEFGGKDFEANKALAQQAVAKFGGPEFRKVMNEEGWGDHPQLFAFMVKVAKGFAEDDASKTAAGAKTGGALTKAEKDEAIARELYPNSPEMFGEPPRQKQRVPGR